MSDIEKIILNGNALDLVDLVCRKSVNNLSSVAKSGAYNDLTGKPVIPEVTILKNTNFSKMSISVNGVKKTLIWGKDTTHANITNPYGNGYYGNHTVILPDNIGTIDNYESCLVSIFARGALVNANVDFYTKNSVKLVLSSTLAINTDITISLLILGEE